MIVVKQVKMCITNVLMIMLAVYNIQFLQVTNIGHTGAINREHILGTERIRKIKMGFMG